MKKTFVVVSMGIMACLLVQCTGRTSEQKPKLPPTTHNQYGGFESPEKWGQHLVTVSGCHDCHTPKKMTAMGMELDSSRLLSGYSPAPGTPQVNRKEMEQKGLTVTGDLTSWVGPWGVSFTANLTSDESGIGNWTETQFITALREGKLKGMSNTRPLLPPMPWQMYRHMRDEEIKAIFAYLKATQPVKNVVPPPLPPAAAIAAR